MFTGGASAAFRAFETDELRRCRALSSKSIDGPRKTALGSLVNIVFIILRVVDGT